MGHDREGEGFLEEVGELAHRFGEVLENLVDCLDPDEPDPSRIVRCNAVVHLT